MRRLRDVQCPYCKTVYMGELCDDDHTCSCGRRTVTYFGGDHMSRNAETPIVFGSVTYSPSEWEAFRKEWKARHHEDLNVVGDSRQQRKQALEEAQHANIQQAKRRGMHSVVREIESAGGRIR